MFHVKQKLNLPDLIEFLKSQNIILNEKQINDLHLYHEVLLKWSRQINLISKGDISFLIERHYIPSIYNLKYLINNKIENENTILDIGTGAGFPGIVLSIYFYNNVCLLDSSRKKSLFLKNAISKISGNQTVFCSRVEEETFMKSHHFDIIVARAVAPVSKLAKLVWPVMNKNGYLLTLKGDNYQSEIEKQDVLTIKITELDPIQEWTEYAPYLKNKIMLKLEK